LHRFNNMLQKTKVYHVWVYEHIGRKVAVHIVVGIGRIEVVVVGPIDFAVGKVVGRTVAGRIVAGHTAEEAVVDSIDFEALGLGMWETSGWVIVGRPATEEADQAVVEEVCYTQTGLEGTVMWVRHKV
jgi:predicted ABC-type sugar transport system permease subunit